MSSGFAVLARADENKVGADRIAEQTTRRSAGSFTTRFHLSKARLRPAVAELAKRGGVFRTCTSGLPKWHDRALDFPVARSHVAPIPPPSGAPEGAPAWKATRRTR